MIDFQNSDFAIWSSAFRVLVRSHFPFCRSRKHTSSISFPCWIWKILSPGSQPFPAKTGVVSLRKWFFSLFWYLSLFWSYLGKERVLDDRATRFGIVVRCSIEQTMHERDIFLYSNFACRASYTHWHSLTDRLSTRENIALNNVETYNESLSIRMARSLTRCGSINNVFLCNIFSLSDWSVLRKFLCSHLLNFCRLIIERIIWLWNGHMKMWSAG